MYEIWLVMNIVYEIALSLWPLLAVVLAVWLLMLWAALFFWPLLALVRKPPAAQRRL